MKHHGPHPVSRSWLLSWQYVRCPGASTVQYHFFFSPKGTSSSLFGKENIWIFWILFDTGRELTLLKPGDLKHSHHLLGRAGTCWFQIINKKMIILDSLAVWYQISIKIINQWMSSFSHNQYPHYLCALICLWNLFNDCDK